MHKVFGLLCALALSQPVHAEELVKCIDTAGKLTFVKDRCPPVHESNEKIEVKNPPPSGSSPPTRMADPAILNNRQKVKFTVVESGPKLRDMTPQTPTGQKIQSQSDTRIQRMSNPGAE